ITYEFISLDDILQKFERNIKLSKNYTTGKYKRYHDATVHLRAFYPKIFPYKKIAILDVDVELRSPIQELYKQFENMNSHQIAALAYDQTPYYRKAFKGYRLQNKGTKIGCPSPGYQGFNTGVMLFDLEKTRKSMEFNNHLTESGYKFLFEKYNMVSELGDQDFFTLLGAEYPGLFYVLDCSFNRQMSPNFYYNPLFDKYHRCDNDVKIYHGNGRSTIPRREEDP
ncbi:xyloside xylosyltransferase 1-like, partial [Artemia franciscana]|uniref:xyloside xylosyltransferase 1-like n=1 Tax=Artemia franciscana TaxID=6661 RepID=UPI0032DA563D